MFSPINHTKTTNIVLLNMQKMLSNHPSAFDVVIFKADPEGATLINETSTPDVVGSIESREGEMTYQRPITSKGMEIPSDDYQSELMVAMGGFSDGYQETPIVMLLLEPNVPEQSVIYIKESLSDVEKVRTLFVEKVQPIGKEGAAGAKYYLVPFSMDHTVLDDPMNDPLTPVLDADAESEAGDFLRGLLQ